jgi:sugar lactone lactonase YvrE
MTRLVRLLPLAACLATACAHADARRIGTVLPGDPSWPREGNRRIAYVGELRTPENLGIEHGFFARIWRFIAGKDDSEELYRPYAVALSTDGRVAVADPGRRAVHLFDPRRSDYRRISSGLLYPVAVAFAGKMLLVADAERRNLFAYGAEAEPVKLPVLVPELQRPAALAVDGRRAVLFVTDSAAHEVHALPLNGGEGKVLGGRGGAPGQFNFPTHLAVDREGRLYVCDAMNFRVQVFDADLRPLRTFGRMGDRPGDLPRPKGLAVDGAGNVLVVEGYFDLVQVFTGDGQLLGVFGGSGTVPGRFWLPGGAATDGRLLYVADTFNGRVQVFDLEQVAP